MAYWIDWWLLFSFGFIIHLIIKGMGITGWINEYNLKWIKRILMLAVLCFFFCLSGGLLVGFSAIPGNESGPEFLGKLSDWWMDLMRWLYAPYYATYTEATSTEYMFTAAQPWLRDALNVDFNDLAGLLSHPMHLFVGVCLFATYPWLLYLGTWVAEILIGSKFSKNALWKIAWPFIMIILMIIVPLLMYFTLQASIIWDNIGLLTIITEIGIVTFFLLDFILILRKK